jgi:hypothetical protein
MKAIKYWIVLIMLCLSAVACSSGVPRGAVAGCGEFSYVGTLTKSETRGKALWLSDSTLAAKMSAADVIELAQAMGCTTLESV